MGNPLRDRRAPQELAVSGQVIEITEKIGNFTGLSGIVETDLAALDPDKLPPDWRDSPVTGQLRFGFADAQAGVPSLEGRIEVTVDAVCQRCLEPFRLPVSVELRLRFEADGAAGTDEGGYEAWELVDERLRPLDVIDESLIMALPLVAMHVNDSSCVDAAGADDMSKDTVRPFAGLKMQMNEEN